MWCCVDRRFENSFENKNSIRELAALVRTAADATGRAAELMLRLISTGEAESEEIRTIRLLAEDLLNGNELVAKLAMDRFRLEQAVVESQSLKLVCDATICRYPIDHNNAAIRTENNRLALKLNRWPRRRTTDR